METLLLVNATLILRIARRDIMRTQYLTCVLFPMIVRHQGLIISLRIQLRLAFRSVASLTMEIAEYGLVSQFATKLISDRILQDFVLLDALLTLRSPKIRKIYVYKLVLQNQLIITLRALLTHV